MDKKTYVSHSLQETGSIARDFVNTLEPINEYATVIFLVGDLGAGKTTFTKAVAQILDIRQTVISPTFILEKKYAIRDHKYYKTLIHIDAYRFEDPSEAAVLNLQGSIQDPSNLLFVEWPSKLGKSIKADRTVHFKSKAENIKIISW